MNNDISPKLAATMGAKELSHRAVIAKAEGTTP